MIYKHDTIRFLNSVFLFAAVTTFILAFVRGQNNLILGFIDFGFSITFLYLIYYLKYHQKHVDKIAWFAILLSYLLFTAVYLLAPEIGTRSSLFLLLLASVYFLKGKNYGALFLVIIIATILLPEWVLPGKVGYSLEDLIILCLYLIGFFLVLNNFDSAKENHSRELMQENKKMIAETIQIKEELALTKDSLLLDQVTSLMTRQKFINMAKFELEQANRHQYNLSIIIMDIDHFKQINSIFGYKTGDIILLSLANVINNSAKKSDLIARWEADKFIILLPKSPLENAITLANAIDDKISNIDELRAFDISAHYGVAKINKNETLNSFINNALKALTIAKKSENKKVISLNPLYDQ